MATYKGILTNNGKALIAGATVSNKINYSHIAVGDGNGSVPVPSETRTTLINEKARIALNVVEINPNNTNQIVCEAIIPSNVGGFYIRELGLYAGNTMVVNASYPPTYKPLADEGGAREINIKLVINIQNAEVIALYLDDSLIYATREWVNKNYIRRNEIVDNLATNDSTKPLSAKQGKNLQDNKLDKTANAVGIELKENRTLKPTQLSQAIQGFFGTLYSDNSTFYCDLITLNGWIDASGGRKNALVFNKTSQSLHHYQADYAGESWAYKKQIAYTDSDITGNAASATKLQNVRKINGVDFDGTQDINIEAPVRFNGTISNLQQIDQALLDGKYTVVEFNVAGLYGYGVLVVFRSGGMCHQVYYPHQAGGTNNATMAMRQAWNVNGNIASWSDWRIVGTQDDSKLPLVGGTVSGNLRVNGIVFSNKVYGDSDLWFTSENEQKGRRILTGGILASDTFSEANLIPNLGIYAKGAIHTKTGVYADKYFGYNGPATYTGYLDGKLTTPRLINGVAFDASTDINIPPVSFYIPAGADLNKYQKAGLYYQNADVDAAKIANVPQANAFALRVEESAGCSQWLTPYNGGGVVYYRHFYDGTWSTWIKIDPHNIDGNAATATRLQTTRQVSFSGAATGYFNFDGSGNSSCLLTLSNSGVVAGTYSSTIQIPSLTINDKGIITGISQQTIRSATINQSGVVQLADDLTTDDNSKALTAKQGRNLQDNKLDKNENAVGLKMGEDRTLLPTELSPLSLQTFFGTYNSNDSSAFCDFITLNGWIDASGGRKNALVFNKIATGLYHFQADYGSQSWTIKRELAYTDSNISGNAASATKLQNVRKINGVDFDGTQDINIEAPVRFNGTISNLQQIDQALLDGKYTVVEFNVAGLYGYGVLVVFRSGGMCHQVYYPHQAGGTNNATMAMRQAWNVNGNIASWSDWRIVGTQDDSKLPLVGGTVSGNLRVNGIVFSNKVYGDSDLWFTSENEQKGRRILTGGILASDTFSEANLIPNLGIYAKGAIHTKTGVYADKYFGYNGPATYTGYLDGKLTTPRLINGVAFDASTDINIPPVSFYIPAGADLNNYLKTGFYYQDTDAGAAQIANLPQTNAFELRVETSAGSSQWLSPYNGGGVVFYRHYYGGTWSAWIKIDPHNIDGNAATATRLQTARNIALTGAVSGSANFDGSGNITIVTTANNAIGVGQSWSDVTSSRSSNTTYTNTTGKPIQIMVLTPSWNNAGSFDLLVDGVPVVSIGNQDGYNQSKPTSVLISNGSTYRVNGNFQKWSELR